MASFRKQKKQKGLSGNESFRMKISAKSFACALFLRPNFGSLKREQWLSPEKIHCQIFRRVRSDAEKDIPEDTWVKSWREKIFYKNKKTLFSAACCDLMCHVVVSWSENVFSGARKKKRSEHYVFSSGRAMTRHMALMCVEDWTEWMNHRCEEEKFSKLWKIRNDNWRTTASSASTLSHIHTVQLKILSTLTRRIPVLEIPWFSPLHETLFCRKTRPTKTESPHKPKRPTAPYPLCISPEKLSFALQNATKLLPFRLPVHPSP